MWKIEKIVSKGDYDYAVVREHPNATKHGYVLHHRIVMENHLKRLLNSNEIVHHLDGNKKNNLITNLGVMTNSSHAKHHGEERGMKYLELCCPNCKTIFHRRVGNTHLSKGGIATFCSRKCSGTFWRTIGKTHEVDSAISGNIVSRYIRYLHDNPEETT